MGRTFEKIIARLNKEFGFEIPKTEKPRRLYHGRHQRSIGAWSWGVGGTSTFKESYGSQWSATELLKKKHLIPYFEYGGDISILPVSEDEYKEWLKENGRKWKI